MFLARLLSVGLTLIALSSATQAQTMDYTPPPPQNWEFFTDQVMGGVSSGKVRVVSASSGAHLHLSGTVSTKNRGGFIQTRARLTAPIPANAQGLILRVRGNDTRYFVHLRTRGTRLPWQYYQAGFDVTGAWREIRIPFSDFERSGSLLRATIKPDRITSVGVVAYGRDHVADVYAEWIGIY
ncbi:CIA30 family protein [Shimia sp. W99]